VASLTLVALVTFVASSGWAATFEGNLKVTKSQNANSADGNLTVDRTTRLKGITTLGDDASDTITFKGPIIAEDALIQGNEKLKIHSVDGTGNGVVTSDEGIAENLSNEKIPTAKAVKAYVDAMFIR
jgi:hypothetical protein